MRTGTLEQRIRSYRRAAKRTPNTDLKDFAIWMEGYAATGEHGYAQYMATIKATNFAEACHKLALLREWGDLYDPDELSYWRCCLFPNEQEARQGYG